MHAYIGERYIYIDNVELLFFYDLLGHDKFTLTGSCHRTYQLESHLSLGPLILFHTYAQLVFGCVWLSMYKARSAAESCGMQHSLVICVQTHAPEAIHLASDQSTGFPRLIR